MGGKKQLGRFTIQFNEADPQQRQVIELLNRQGRRKAVFLTCAVLAYCGQGTAPAVPPPSPPPSIEPAMIEQIVQKVLRQNTSAVPVRQDSMKAAEPTGRAAASSVLPTAPTPPTTPLPAEDMNLPDVDLAAICDTIDAFRR